MKPTLIMIGADKERVWKSRTSVFIVSSVGPRIGKTLLARLLADYFLIEGRGFQGFDTHPYEPEFAERFRRFVKIADLNSVAGQMALFDPLLIPDAVPKIIDLWHHATDLFFTLCDQTGFIAEAHRAGIAPILVFFAEASPRSLALAHRVMDRNPQLMMIAVDNEGAAPLARVGRDAVARYPAQRFVTMAPLDPVLRGTVALQGFSFSRFMLTPPADMSIVLRAGLKTWTSQMMAQLKSMEFGMIFQESEHLS